MGGDTALRWDNTIGYSASFRLREPTPTLLLDRNRDDGDRNFDRGIVSNRLDLLSQLDFSKSWFGFHASGAAWYDTVYFSKNDNDSAATFNSVSVPHDKFTAATQTRHGAQAEVLDAFVYGNGELGGTPFSFRLGRHTLLWGESLFFADNGIAAGQAPIDTTRVLTRPGGYARDAYLPVTQASLSVQLPGDMSVEGYYQFEWRRSRLPASGSYFSYRDYYDAGGERFYLRSGYLLFRDRDFTPPSSGQFGLALRGSLGEVDYGFYGLRMNSKDPVPYYRAGVFANPGQPPVITDPSIVDLSINKGGTYNVTYPQGIEIYGASASFYAGNSTVAGELSMRRHTPLTSMLVFLNPGQVADANCS